MTSTLRQLLVHLDAGASAPARLAAARALASRHGATVSALYASSPVVLQLPYPPETASGLAAALLDVDAERRRATRRMFDEAVRAPGPRTTWAESSAVPPLRGMLQQALYADLLVLGQRVPDEAATAGVPGDFVESVVIGSGRPALVLPYISNGHVAARTAVIAWKETPEAARAVQAALPLLRAADQVHVLTWGVAPEPEASGTLLDLAGYLDAHGVRAVQHHGGPEPQEAIGDLLLSRVADLGGDLLVMGCYGHSRARELVLGGATRTVLRTMTVPVLLAH